MGVIIAFAVMIVLVWKKVPLAMAAVVAGIVMCLLSGMGLLETMTGPFMEGAAGFIKSWFLLFLFCAIYAAAMDAAGAAYSLGKWISGKVGSKFAIWGVSLAALVMTYGGISCFVIVFAMYPIALIIFREAKISRRLIPATIAAGAFTAPNTLIGSPAICNIIPTYSLGTTPMAAPVVSIVASVIMYIIANVWLIYLTKRDSKKGIFFEETEKIRTIIAENENRETVSPLLSVIPLVAIIVSLNVFKLNVLIAVFCGIVAAFVLFWKRIDDKLGVFVTATQSGINSVMTVSPAVGLGNIAKATSFFSTVVNWVTSMNGAPLVSWAIANAVLSFVCSSGSAAQTLANDLLSPTYLAMGCNPEILHRISSFGILAASATPWNGTICVTMGACDLTHKEAYPALISMYVISNLVGVVIAIVMGMLLY